MSNTASAQEIPQWSDYVGAWTKTGHRFPRTPEGYLEFLKTPFWIELAARKLRQDPFCQFTGCTHHAAHTHHVFYRRNWMETQITDLLSVCPTHHRKVHRVPDTCQPKPRHQATQQHDPAQQARIKADQDRRYRRHLEALAA